jgi:hypothetical protein
LALVEGARCLGKLGLTGLAEEPLALFSRRIFPLKISLFDD